MYNTRIVLDGSNPITEESIQILVTGSAYTEGAISIYDLSGRKVSSISYKIEHDGKACCILNVANLSSGIYYIQDNSSESGDIIGVTVLR